MITRLVGGIPVSIALWRLKNIHNFKTSYIRNFKITELKRYIILMAPTNYSMFLITWWFKKPFVYFFFRFPWFLLVPCVGLNSHGIFSPVGMSIVILALFLLRKLYFLYSLSIACDNTRRHDQTSNTLTFGSYNLSNLSSSMFSEP